MRFSRTHRASNAGIAVASRLSSVHKRAQPGNAGVSILFFADGIANRFDVSVSAPLW